MSRRFIVPIVLAALVAGLLSGCSAADQLSVTARFTDILDLSQHAPVMMNDVQVGKVTEIRLDHNQALVTMSIRPEAHVPAAVIARVRRTSLLGERIVDLIPPENLPLGAPLLRDGQRIEQTVVRPDLEDLVRQGNEVLAPIAASQVAILVDEGARGFGGQGPELRQMLHNFGEITRAYADRTGDIESLIRSLNQLNTSLASHADAQARSVANSAQALDVLADESARLQTAVRALARLAVGGRGILEAHSDEMARFFSQMRVILGILVEEQGSINGFLQWAPFHNRGTQMVEYLDFNQILQDFVICGFNDDPEDLARRCKE